MHSRVRHVIVAGSLLFLGTPLAAATEPVACDEAAFARVIGDAGNGNPAPLLAFAEFCSSSGHRTEALRLAARIAYDTKDYDTALRLLQLLPPTARVPADAVLEGATLVRQGSRVRDGLARLQAINPATLEPVDRGARLLALAEGSQRSGEVFAAIQYLNEAARLSTGEEQRRIYGEAHRLIRERASDADLLAVEPRLGNTPLRLDLLTEQARRALQKKDTVTAKRVLDTVLTSELPFDDRSDALQLRDQLEGAAWLRRGVGVLLPLSGTYEAFGKAVQRGMEMALAERPPQARPIAFLFRDGGASAEENVRAIERLAQEDRVMAVIGPLTGSAALAAGEAAQGLHIPLLSLASREGVPETGDFVFRDALTSHKQVETLVQYAMERQGLKRFAILAPDSRSGAELADLFADVASRHGATIVARQAYSEGEVNFRAPIKRLIGEDPALPDPVDKEARKNGRSPAATLPFDAIFIPDIGERVAMIAPYLAFYGVSRAQLLGTSAWNSPTLLEQAGRYVDGAVFVDGFFADAGSLRFQAFVERYRERYGEEPSILEAEGYDLANLFLMLLERSDIRTRIDLRTALENLRPFPGVTGELAFDAIGETRKKPFLLRIDNSSIVLAE